jgi:ribose 5-phosphate isomerase A
LANISQTEFSELKRIAGEKVIEFIKPGMIVGLGSGSTAFYGVKKLGELISDGTLRDIKGIATSSATEANAKKFGIPLTGLSENPKIDLTFDGADEVDSSLDLIKGGGGALLREKIVAQASTRMFVVVDESKLSAGLGEKWPLPIEVVRMAERVETIYLESLGATCATRKNEMGERYITDEGNFIIDADFGIIDNKRKLDQLLSARAGIVETGLFIGLATDLVCATGHGVKHIEKSAVDRHQNLFVNLKN